MDPINMFPQLTGYFTIKFENFLNIVPQYIIDGLYISYCEYSVDIVNNKLNTMHIEYIGLSLLDYYYYLNNNEFDIIIKIQKPTDETIYAEYIFKTCSFDKEYICNIHNQSETTDVMKSKLPFVYKSYEIKHTPF